MWENDVRWPAAKWPHESSARSWVKCSVSRQEVLSPGWCWQSPPSPSHRETQTTSERSVASLPPAPILPECWGNIKILKLWFENYFSKGKFIGEVFLSHSASTLLWLPEWCLAIKFYLLVLLYLYLRWKTLGPSLPITVMTWSNLISWGAMSVQSKKRK